MERELRQVPIYEIGSRTSLLMGADRQLLLGSGGLCFISWYCVPNMFVGMGALITFFILLKLLRILAKKDPLMKEVFKRHISYKANYSAKGTPFDACKKKYV